MPGFKLAFRVCVCYIDLIFNCLCMLNTWLQRFINF
nr:MAG TPA: hypothetical protein [Caudoviricetes sp.]